MISSADKAGDPAQNQENDQPDHNKQRAVDDVQDPEDFYVLRHITFPLPSILPTLLYECGVRKFRESANS